MMKKYKRLTGLFAALAILLSNVMCGADDTGDAAPQQMPLSCCVSHTGLGLPYVLC